MFAKAITLAHFPAALAISASELRWSNDQFALQKS
jgi:hypothetical protein